MNTAFNIRENGTIKLLHVFKTNSDENHDEVLVLICEEVNINNANLIYLSSVTEENFIAEYKKNKRPVCEKCIAAMNNS